METNQKNREAARQRRPQQEGKKRPPQAQEQHAKKRRPAAEEQQAPRKRRSAAEEQQAPKKRRPTAEEPQPARKRRPVTEEQPRRTPAQERPAARRPAQPGDAQSAFRREEGVQYSAPQGTGPRKSAPQRSPQERAAQSKRPAAQPRKQQKKRGLQGLIAGFRGEKDPEAPMSEQAKKRQEQRAAKAEKRRKQAERNNTPAIIYTQPQAFNRNRLFVQLLTVTAVVVALVLGLSVFFKVQTITVSGAEVYSAWAIREASGIQEGDNLLTFSRARATAQLTAKLPYVEKARIGIKLPETVIIYIEEMDVAYAIKSDEGAWWLMNSNGRLVEQINNSTAKNYTQVLGVTLANPAAGEDAVAAEAVPVETAAEDATGATDASEAPAPVTVTGAQRLYAALQILKALETNDIVGEAASVNVTRLEDVILWYGTRYQVNLGDTSRMEYKIACMNDVILQMSDYDSGVLDLSFTNFGDQVGYTPFE